MACGVDGWGRSHEDPPEDESDDAAFDDEESPFEMGSTLFKRQFDNMRSILQPELTSPNTWEDGPDIWWGQILAMVEHSKYPPSFIPFAPEQAR